MTNGPTPLKIWQKLAYASGQAGNVVGYQLISTFVLALYLPTVGKGEQLIPGTLLGVGTFLVLNILARGFDTFFDPFLANTSDRSTHRLGRRRIFMIVGVFPLALVTALIFLPPGDPGSLTNVIWLGFTMTAYFGFFSVYVAPYLALLPELAPDKAENTKLSTLQAAAALVGAMIVSVVAPPLFLHEGAEAQSSMKAMAVALAVMSFILLLVPVLAIDERALVHRKEGEAASHLGFVASLKATFADRGFRPYVLGCTLFFCGFTVLQTGAYFYVTALLNKEPSAQPLVVGPLFGVAALSFVPVAMLANKIGKRRMIIAGALFLALDMGIGIPLLPSMPFLTIPVFALGGVPIAMFLALPNSMLADVCEANARATGQRREAMFFGAQGFLQKISLALAAGSFSQLAETFGKSVDNPLGIQLSGPLAAVFLVGSAICFFLYPEAEVQRIASGK